MLKNFLLISCGIIALIAGITLVLKEWGAVVTVFNGVIGGALAVVGLVMLAMVKGGK